MIVSSLLQLLFGDFIIFVLIITLCWIIFIDYWTKHWKNQLPGPFNLPFLGYVPFLCSKKPHELLAKLPEKYGSTIGFYLGARYVITLNDIKAIREVINREEFLGRPIMHPMDMFEKNSMFISSGHVWKQERRLALRIFHELGFGRRIMEERVKDEISYFMARIDKHEGSPFAVKDYLQETVNNNISSLIFGHRYDYNDPTATVLMDNVAQLEESVPNVDIAAFFPYLKPLVNTFGNNLISKSRAHSEVIARIIRKEMDNEMKHLDDEHIRSYLHGYLLQMKNNKDGETFTEDALMGTARVHYIAGTSTTVNTIEWLLLGLISNPDVQTQLHREIDKMFSWKTDINWSDQKDMPYTRAVILETMRWRTLVPLSVPRCVTKDTTIQGYRIPRGTIVFPNIWATNNDPSIWHKPEEFNPQRFLDEESKLINSDLSVPFSFGRRSCPGENLAQLQIFLYSVNILRKYNVSLPVGDTLELDGIPRFTYVPKKFRVLLTSRN